MKMPDHPVVLGIILFIINIAIAIFIQSIWMSAIAAGILGFSYSREKGRALPMSTQIQTAVITGVLNIVAAVLLLSRDGDFLTVLQETFSGYQLAFIFIILSLVVPILLTLLGLSVGSRIGLPKKA